MPAFSYKERFVDFVEEGLRLKPRKGKRVKRCTIRNFRKHVTKKGDTLYHFFALRTKWCRRLGTSICKSNRNIIINHHAIFIAKEESGYPEWKGSYQEIKKPDELNAFAYADGFEDWEHMKRWWIMTHGPGCFPFVGTHTQW